jgi:hypothetical protein
MFFIFVILLFLIDNVFAGNGGSYIPNTINPLYNILNIDLYIYDSNNFFGNFVQQSYLTNELLCTYYDIKIVNLHRISDPQNVRYTDIYIYDHIYDNIRFPYTQDLNIKNLGTFNGINGSSLTPEKILLSILQYIYPNNFNTYNAFYNNIITKRCFITNNICNSNLDCDSSAPELKKNSK